MRSNRSDLPSGPVLPLPQMRAGESGEVVNLRGGRGPVRRLTELGITPGVTVKVVSDSGSFGPVMIRIGDTKIGIGRGMARRILVRPSPRLNET